MLTGAAGTAVAAGVGVGLPAVARSRRATVNPLLFHSPPATPFVDDLPLLPTLSGTDITVTARTRNHTFHSDYGPSPSLAYHDATHGLDHLGPVIEARRGELTRLRLRNQMGVHPFADDVDTSLHGATEQFGTRPRTTLHLHGGVTKPQFDGHPEDYIDPGEQLTNRYDNDQEAAALWYHDHSLGTTRLNVYAGLAAPYLLRDEFDTGGTDNAWGLPSGEFEQPLVLQEKIFESNGDQSIRSTPIVPEGHWEGGARSAIAASSTARCGPRCRSPAASTGSASTTRRRSASGSSTSRTACGSG